MRLPFDGSYPITTAFGVHDPSAYARYPGQNHPGVDFPLPYGTKLVAAMSGYVKTYKPTGYIGRGWEVVITNGPTQVKTCHMSRIDVADGEYVEEGQTIGASGNTGYVLPRPDAKNPYAGSHLHFELMLVNEYRDITKYVKEEEMPKATADDVYWGYRFIAGKKLTPEQVKATKWVGADLYEFQQALTKDVSDKSIDYAGYKEWAEKRIAELEKGVDPKYIEFAKATEKFLKG